MKYLKTIENLFEKARNNNDGVANINGRPSYYFGEKGELQSKYRITFTANNIFMEHWGTEIIDINTAEKQVVAWYGESNSDRDAINMLLYLLSMDHKYLAIYRPSNVGFKVVKVEPKNA